ncbi:MAG: ATP-binding cassette domain-containing protein [Dehalococcoidia bacterium]|nr:ATP-binding cassette domain-containing protein [Dehalococcoidia bacterium]
MLTINQVSRHFGGRAVLGGVTFVVNAGAPAGIVGPNGSGKTTLLRIIAGALAADGGHVETPEGARVAVLPQGYAGRLDEPLASVFPSVFLEDIATRLLSEVGERLAHEADEAAATRLGAEYDALLAQLAAPAGPPLAEHARELGLRDVDPTAPAGSLSGGELAKLGLIELVAQQPDILLLDEPTNHLDLRGIEWVEAYIEGFLGAVVIVSHDRALLDRVASSIVALDPRGGGTAEVFAGNYSDYAEEQARREAELWERYRRQVREERQLRRTISAIESRARNIEQRTIDFHYRKRAKKVARRSTTMKARLEREIASAEHVDRPQKAVGGFRGAFGEAERGTSVLARAEGVAVDVAGRRLVDGASFVVRRGDRVVLAGENGSGKTTLLRALLGEHPIAAGELALGASTQVGYLPQEDGDAIETDADLTPVEIVRSERPMTEEAAYNFLHRFLFGQDQLRSPLGRLSYGERRHLALALLVLGGADLLLLDEPTNHLDLPSREAFEASLAAFEGAAVVVTHDRYFIERWAETVLELEDGRLATL